MERLAVRAIFDGSVPEGRPIVLADDVSVMGGTLADLADHVLSQGAQIAGAVLLANASRSGVLTLAPRTASLVERRYGDAIEELFGIEPGCLRRKTKDASDYGRRVFQDRHPAKTRAAE
jgi:orotate phosphoribosyltransferase